MSSKAFVTCMLATSPAASAWDRTGRGAERAPDRPRLGIGGPRPSLGRTTGWTSRLVDQDPLPFRDGDRLELGVCRELDQQATEMPAAGAHRDPQAGGDSV